MTIRAEKEFASCTVQSVRPAASGNTRRGESHGREFTIEKSGDGRIELKLMDQDGKSFAARTTWRSRYTQPVGKEVRCLVLELLAFQAV